MRLLKLNEVLSKPPMPFCVVAAEEEDPVNSEDGELMFPGHFLFELLGALSPFTVNQNVDYW
jgi:hypothetical protein